MIDQEETELMVVSVGLDALIRGQRNIVADHEVRLAEGVVLLGLLVGGRFPRDVALRDEGALRGGGGGIAQPEPNRGGDRGLGGVEDGGLVAGRALAGNDQQQNARVLRVLRRDAHVEIVVVKGIAAHPDGARVEGDRKRLRRRRVGDALVHDAAKRLPVVGDRRDAEQVTRAVDLDELALRSAENVLGHQVHVARQDTAAASQLVDDVVAGGTVVEFRVVALGPGVGIAICQNRGRGGKAAVAVGGIGSRCGSSGHRHSGRHDVVGGNGPLVGGERGGAQGLRRGGCGGTGAVASSHGRAASSTRNTGRTRKRRALFGSRHSSRPARRDDNLGARGKLGFRNDDEIARIDVVLHAIGGKGGVRSAGNVVFPALAHAVVAGLDCGDVRVGAGK